MKKERLNAMNDAIYDTQKKKNIQDKENLWLGEYTEIVESEFLPYVTKAKFSAVHFYHMDFERCKIIDMHLAKIAPEHKECKFLKLNADKAPFFIQKLGIKVLPTICLFKDGVLMDQVIGFQDLGNKDDFKTIDLVRRLVKSDCVTPNNKMEKGF
mmetsp:Transcript_14476/g.12280  ORF Transcript_14476/g.12280 Transcript_14476/m.12280 type:complete len:155 (+) Transcript_14476:139-603(+)